MNTSTGEIREFPVDQPIPRGWVKLGKQPNADCYKCKGTGVRRINKAGRRIPCGCTKF